MHLELDFMVTYHTGEPLRNPCVVSGWHMYDGGVTLGFRYTWYPMAVMEKHQGFEVAVDVVVCFLQCSQQVVGKHGISTPCFWKVDYPTGGAWLVPL